MRKQRIIVPLLMAAGLLVLTVPGFAQDPNFHIYLCFGQSNMEGQGAVETVDRSVDERFQVMQAVTCSNLGRVKGRWYKAVPPLCRCWNGLSPADYFGRAMVNSLPEDIRIGVINVSVGGCRIELFDKDQYQDFDDTIDEDWFRAAVNEYGGNPYEHLVELALQAQQDGVIKGILLHQGESNTGDSQWPAKVKKIYEDLMDDLSLDPWMVPLLAGEVVHADQGGVCASMNAIMAQLPKILRTAYVISSRGCPDMGDDVHFSSEGYREFGRRYAAQMLSLMGYQISDVPGPAGLPAEFVLEQNYPNPFNPVTEIKFHMPEKSVVTLEVMDVTGRTVEVPVSQAALAGEQTVVFSGHGLPGGIYFYRLSTQAGMVITRKMVLVK